MVLSSAVLVADDHSVIFDEDVDYAIFRTFAVRDGRMSSERPELSFPPVMQALSEAIRTTLTTRGLTEAQSRADLAVEFSVTGVDFSIGSFGRPNPIRPGQRGRGRGTALPVDFTEATLVIDLKTGDPGTLVWRGVYHDTEKDARKLAEALPKDARKLLSEYPPRKRT